MSSALPTRYDPAQHEAALRERWETSGVFHPDPASVITGAKPAYSIVIPPPNVTARLHLGHALNNTLQDILVRAHRMKGFETLWMPGTDHAGIATQTVVDRRLRAAGEPALADYKRMEAAGEPGRERFVEKVQAWKDEYEAAITDQLKRMGCSCDWTRQRFTMDEICARAVREAFFRLFKDGLIYRGKRLVNWDPVTQTALADDEVEMKDVEGAFYYLRYPLVHPSTNDADPLDAQEVTWSELAARGYPGAHERSAEQVAWITVATTRPETYLGDTAVAVNPNDPRAAALDGLCCQLPLVGRIIPIIQDDYVVMPSQDAEADPDAEAERRDASDEPEDPKAKFATGFLKVTPAHDPNDWDIGQRHMDDIRSRCSAGEAVINVMAPDASISSEHGWMDFNPHAGAEVFIGKTREAARELAVAEFKARNVPGSNEPLLERVKPYTHAVGHSYRSHAPIEPYLSDQWYCKVSDDRLVGSAQRALAAEQRTTDSHGASDSHGSSHGSHGARGTDVSQGDGAMRFHPARYAKTYESWHDNLRDWCISRQLWWGHRIPVWSFEFASRDGAADFERYVRSIRAMLASVGDPDVVMQERSSGDDRILEICARDDDGAGVLDAVADLLSERGPFFTALAAAGGDVASIKQRFPHHAAMYEAHASELGFLQECSHPPNCGQDPDVLDTWFSSALWPLSTLGWPAADLPIVTPHQIDAEHADRIADVWVKRVGAWKDLIGEAGRESGELIDRLLHLRDHTPPAEGLAYQLFREADLRAHGTSARPLTAPDDIQSADDLVCAVAIKTEGVVDAGKHGAFAIRDLLLRHGFQNTAGLLEAFNPTSVLSTGRDIITLWVSRMVMFNRYFLGGAGFQPATGQPQAGDGQNAGPAESAAPGPPPFYDVFIHAMVQDGHGQRMSKSLGNGVDPLDLIESHGADAVRFVLCHMTTQTQDVRMPVDLVCPHSGEIFTPEFIENAKGDIVAAPTQTCPKDAAHRMVSSYGDASGEAAPTDEAPLARNTSSKFDMGRNFVTKFWNASRFTMMVLGESDGAREANDAGGLGLIDRWMLSRLARTIRDIDDALARYQFSVYAQSLYDILWRDFCDWHLEGVKPTVKSSPAQQRVLRDVLDAIVRLMHPVLPYASEVVWAALQSSRPPGEAAVEGLELAPSSSTPALLCAAAWPKADASLIDEAAEADFGVLRDLVEAIRQVRAKQQVPQRRRITLHAPPEMAAAITAGGGLVETLAGLGGVTADPGGTDAAPLSVGGVEYALSDLADAVDPAVELAALAEQRTALEKDVAQLDKRLSNPGYAEKAPAHLVQQTRDQMAGKQKELAGVVKRMEELS